MMPQKLNAPMVGNKYTAKIIDGYMKKGMKYGPKLGFWGVPALLAAGWMIKPALGY